MSIKRESEDMGKLSNEIKNTIKKNLPEQVSSELKEYLIEAEKAIKTNKRLEKEQITLLENADTLERENEELRTNIDTLGRDLDAAKRAVKNFEMQEIDMIKRECNVGLDVERGKAEAYLSVAGTMQEFMLNMSHGGTMTKNKARPSE